mmetsp:Transcript_17930/g.43571  ORF Transcript_17930/g.43571 Transcript_17930/m.43571 type:complete len:201 (-) Transcript_17930:1104-1706(-)
MYDSEQKPIVSASNRESIVSLSSLSSPEHPALPKPSRPSTVPPAALRHPQRMQGSRLFSDMKTCARTRLLDPCAVYSSNSGVSHTAVHTAGEPVHCVLVAVENLKVPWLGRKKRHESVAGAAPPRYQSGKFHEVPVTVSIMPPVAWPAETESEVTSGWGRYMRLKVSSPKSLPTKFCPFRATAAVYPSSASPAGRGGDLQ